MPKHITILDTGSFLPTSSYYNDSSSFDSRILTASGGSVNTSSLLPITVFNAYTASILDSKLVIDDITIIGDGNNPSPLRISNTGVVSGSYVNPNVIIDQQGRITSASNGLSYLDTGSFVLYTSSINTQISNIFISESNYNLTSSFQLFTSSIHSFTSSINAWSASYIIVSGSINTQLSNIFISESKYLLTSSFNIVTLTSAATVSWDVTSGSNAKLTLSNTSSVFSLLNARAGYTYVLENTQDVTGSRWFKQWPSGSTWIGGVTASLSTGSGAVDMIVFYYNGTNFRITYNGPFS